MSGGISGPRVKPVCPHCASDVQCISFFGQKSYLCKSCRRWDQWKLRKTVSLKSKSS